MKILQYIFALLSCFFFYTSMSQPNSSLKKKAEKIIAVLKDSGEYAMGAKDTLIDLNGDRYLDLLIEYYGGSGTGLKNRITVFLYDSSKKQFRDCGQLNYLGNPTFYFKKKEVAGYYIALGGDSATQLKWNGLKLDTLEYIEVEVLGNSADFFFRLTSRDYKTKKKTIQRMKTLKLPPMYKYWKYTPIIKREN